MAKTKPFVINAENMKLFKKYGSGKIIKKIEAPWNKHIEVGSIITLREEHSTWAGNVVGGKIKVIGMEQHWQGNIPTGVSKTGELVNFGYDNDGRASNMGYKVVKR